MDIPATRPRWLKPSDSILKHKDEFYSLISEAPEFYDVRINPNIAQCVDEAGDVLELFAESNEGTSLGAFTDLEMDLEDALGVAVSVFCSQMTCAEQTMECSSWPSVFSF